MNNNTFTAMIQTRIIDVVRKPSKCPVCGERVMDIVYGTGEMEETEFFLKYRKEAIMGGDNIPRIPPIWACCCGCKRFRKVDESGNPVPVKVKMLKDVRKAPATKILWESDMVESALNDNPSLINYYSAEITTELGETEQLRIAATGVEDAKATAIDLVESNCIGLKGVECVKCIISEQ